MTTVNTTAAEHARYTKTREIITTIILAIASLLTAWSGYEASQWGSVQSLSSSQASARRVQASQKASLSGQDRLVDILTFTNWLEALNAQDQRLADFYRARFRAEFTPAFEAWLATQPLTNPNAPRTPFEMAEYQSRQQAESALLEQEANALTDRANQALDTSSRYVRTTLFLASALFFAAISKTFDLRGLQIATLVIAGGLLLLGVLFIIPLPIV